MPVSLQTVQHAPLQEGASRSSLSGQAVRVLIAPLPTRERGLTTAPTSRACLGSFSGARSPGEQVPTPQPGHQLAASPQLSSFVTTTLGVGGRADGPI